MVKAIQQVALFMDNFRIEVEKCDMKKIIIIKIVSFLLIGCILIYAITRIFTPKWTTAKDNRMSYIIKGFYKEPKNSLDVVFMGNSDVYRGISPITLWDEYGIASYNFVSSGQRMWTAYYMMEECFKYQKPELVVLNMDSAFNESSSSESNYRKIFDNMKISSNKLKAIKDSAFKNSKSEMLSYLLPIIRYHSRWNELEDKDFQQAFENKEYDFKGMDLNTDRKSYNDDDAYMQRDDSNEEIGKKSSKYLKKMIELCKENNVELVLMELPSADSWSKDLSDKTKEFADKNGIRFIDMNLNYKEFGLDWKNDTADGGDHLNVYGAEKVSKYLGKIIQEDYNIPNRKNDSNYSSWYESSIKYHEAIKEEENTSK